MRAAKSAASMGDSLTLRPVPPSTSAVPSSSVSSPLLVIYFAVFLDMVGVLMVVPNLVFRWKEVGITPSGLGMVGSIYSSSQLVGGLIIGKLGDRHLGRKRVLLLSFAGAGVSYMLVGVATEIWHLVLSRVIVGLVKQTMTVSTAMVTSFTETETRAQALGRLASVTTAASMSGQALGGFLGARYGKRAPCFAAAGNYAMAIVLVGTLLPSDAVDEEALPVEAGAYVAQGTGQIRRPQRGGVSLPACTWSRIVAFGESFASAFRTTESRRILLLRLLYAFFMRGVYQLHGLYEQQRWEMTPAETGYLGTYKTALSLCINALLVGILAKRFSDTSLILLSLVVSGANAAFEASHNSFTLYVGVNLIVSAITATVTRTTLSTIFSKAVPKRDAGSALSLLDVLNSAVGVCAPLYGGALLGKLGVSMQPLVSCAHYALLFAATWATIGWRSAPSSSTDQAMKEKRA